MSVPQSNSTQTTEKPVVDDERTRLTSVAPFTAVSIGKVTKRSTSSGAIPVASVITTTVGAFRSGNTSTSISCTLYSPAHRIISAATTMASRFFNAKSIILFSIHKYFYFTQNTTFFPLWIYTPWLSGAANRRPDRSYHPSSVALIGDIVRPVVCPRLWLNTQPRRTAE